MNSIRYMQAHNPQPTPTTDRINRSLCWRARFCKRRWRRLTARNELVLRNQGLITTQALAVSKTSPMPLDDLISEGQFGLILAVRLFDFDRGIAFSTYASTCIRRYIQRVSQTHAGTIVLPNHLFATKKRHKYQHDADRARFVGSIEAPTGKRSRIADEILDRDPGPTEADEAANQAMLGRLMGLLTSREREVVVCRYGLGDRDRSTLNEAAGIFGVTRERVRQLEHQAIGKMAETYRKGVAG